jgi:predicted nucleic acid-binding protein
MTVVGDTSGILASLDRAHPEHKECLDVVRHAQAVVVSPLVLAELDYMITTRFGYPAALAFLGEVERGVYEVADVARDEILIAKNLLDRYASLPLGLTDAVNVVLADGLGTDRILTLDQRHFRAITPMTGRFPAFRISPFDD